MAVGQQRPRLDEEPGDGQEREGGRRNVVQGCDGVQRQAPPLRAQHTDLLDALPQQPAMCSLPGSGGVSSQR